MDLSNKQEALTIITNFRYMGRGIPLHMREGLVDYLVDRVQPGGFLAAVLGNNLREAAAKADDINLWILPVYVAFLLEYAPKVSWGSRENVKDWLEIKI